LNRAALLALGASMALMAVPLVAPVSRWDEAARCLAVVVVLSFVGIEHLRRSGHAARLFVTVVPLVASYCVLEFTPSPLGRHLASAAATIGVIAIASLMLSSDAAQRREVLSIRPMDRLAGGLFLAVSVLGVLSVVSGDWAPNAASVQTSANVVATYLVVSRFIRRPGGDARLLLPVSLVACAVPVLLAGSDVVEMITLESRARNLLQEHQISTSARLYAGLARRNQERLGLPAFSTARLVERIGETDVIPAHRFAMGGHLLATTASTYRDWDAARKDLTQALRQWPGDEPNAGPAEVRRWLGWCLVNLRQWRTLATVAQAGLQRSPDDLELQALQTLALVKRGDYHPAARAAERLWAQLKIDPQPEQATTPGELALWLQSVPDVLHKYAQAMSAYETQQTLAAAGLPVTYAGDRLGDLPSPVSLKVTSVAGGVWRASGRSTTSRLEVGGRTHAGRRGYNLAAIDAQTGEIDWLRLSLKGSTLAQITEWIEATPPGRVVVCFSHQTATRLTSRSSELRAGLRLVFDRIGLAGPSLLASNPPGPRAHVVVGILGAPAGTAIEQVDSRLVEWSMLSRIPGAAHEASTDTVNRIRLRASPGTLAVGGDE
jgi:hypothetical protein